MIQKIYINVPGDTHEGGYWIFMVGEKLHGYKVTEITHLGYKDEYYPDQIFMYGNLPGGDKTLLRVFNYAHVICQDYV